MFTYKVNLIQSYFMLSNYFKHLYRGVSRNCQRGRQAPVSVRGGGDKSEAF